MKKKPAITSIAVLLISSVILLTGCGKTPETSSDNFTASCQLENGRSLSLSGRSDAIPGEQADYVLSINNNTERWQDEYYILLLDSDSVIQEIEHSSFDIAERGGIQKPIKVIFPENISGALGLCVLVPHQGSFIAAISVGSKNAIATGWPDISNYPFNKTGS